MSAFETARILLLRGGVIMQGWTAELVGVTIVCLIVWMATEHRPPSSRNREERSDEDR